MMARGQMTPGDFRARMTEWIVGLERDLASELSALNAAARKIGDKRDGTIEAMAKIVQAQDFAETEIRRVIAGVDDATLCKIMGKHIDWLRAGQT